MSAFGGLFYRDGRPAAVDALAPVIAKLAPYGRDRRATWAGGPVALAHLTTYVTPQAANAEQPYAGPDGNISLVYDGRLDNRAELATALAVPDERRAAIADVELVAHGYARWGTALPERLLGDFAFAVWDAAERRLFCARDIMGVKPLYYYESAALFALATDIAGLLAVEGVPRRLDLAYMNGRFEGLAHHPERTAYDGICILPPATRMIITAEGRRQERYWEPPLDQPVHFADDRDYAARLAELWRTAVADRLRSSHPTGSHISAGLDSTGVTVLAGRLRRRSGLEHIAFAYAPPRDVPLEKTVWERKYSLLDDRAVVGDICAAEKIPLVYTSLSPEALAEHWLMDQTVRPWLSGLPQEWTIAQEAAARGVRSMLTGFGGDEVVTFNGRGYIDSLVARRALGRILMELWGLSRIDEAFSFWRPAAGHIARWLLGERRWQQRRRREAPPPVHSWPSFLRRDFAEAARQTSPLRHEQRAHPPSVRGHQRELLLHGHLAHRMESWATNGRHGIAYSYPLLDQRLITFGLNIPDHLFHRRGRRRWVAREALAGIVPDTVRWNPYKLDASVMASLPTANPAVEALVRERLAAERSRIEAAGIVDLDALLEMEPFPWQWLWLAAIR